MSRSSFCSSVGVQGERGGVIREAESVKCLVETQSPSLATDLCLLSEGQSWASQLPFSSPKKSGVRWVEGSSPIPCNLALCHSCKLGPDICKSLPPFLYTSLFHLFSLDLFPSSNKAPFRRRSLVSAGIHSFIHLCKRNTFLCVHIHIKMCRTGRNYLKDQIPGDVSNHCVTISPNL